MDGSTKKKTLSLRIQSHYNELIQWEPFFQYCNLFANLTHFEAIFAISAVCKIRKSSKKEKIKQIQIFAQSFNLLIRNDTIGTDRKKIMHISFIGTKQPLQVTLSVCLNECTICPIWQLARLALFLRMLQDTFPSTI